MCPHIAERASSGVSPLSYKGISPSVLGHILWPHINLSPPHKLYLQIELHWALRLQHMNLKGTHSDHNADLKLKRWTENLKDMNQCQLQPGWHSWLGRNTALKFSIMAMSVLQLCLYFHVFQIKMDGNIKNILNILKVFTALRCRGIPWLCLFLFFQVNINFWIMGNWFLDIS